MGRHGICILPRAETSDKLTNFLATYVKTQYVYSGILLIIINIYQVSLDYLICYKVNKPTRFNHQSWVDV